MASAGKLTIRFDPEEFALTKAAVAKLWKVMEPHVEPWRAEQALADLTGAVVDMVVFVGPDDRVDTRPKAV